MKTLVTLLVCSLLIGCTNLNRTIITITDIRFAVMNELGAERRAGRINDEDWQKIVEIDDRYRFAANTAADVLTVYQQTGQGDTTAAIRAVKDVVTILIDTLAKYQVVFAANQKAQLSKSTKL